MKFQDTVKPGERAEILAKVRKLLALADTSRGSTEHEARMALGKAQELMARYGIAQVEAECDDFTKPNYHFQSRYFRTGRQKYEHESYAGMICEECFGVKVYHSSYREWSEKAKAYKKRHSYFLVGEEMEIEVAILVLELLHSAMRKGYAAWLRTRGEKFSAKTAYSYYAGVAMGYIQASEQGKALAMRQASKESADKYALVLVQKKDALEDWVKDNCNITDAAKREREWDQRAYVAGHVDGARLDLLPENKLKHGQEALEG